MFNVIFNNYQPTYCCATPEPHCLCQPDERVLRAIAYTDEVLPAMTPEQRSWCVSEADSAGEGYYDRKELEEMTDKDLAKAVLHAWQMYVRSQFG